MKNLKYTALIHCGVFVDERRLEKGIYTAVIPTLHAFNVELSDIRDNILKYGEIIEGYSADKAIKNLEQCELQLIELSFI